MRKSILFANDQQEEEEGSANQHFPYSLSFLLSRDKVSTLIANGHARQTVAEPTFRARKSSPSLFICIRGRDKLSSFFFSPQRSRAQPDSCWKLVSQHHQLKTMSWLCRGDGNFGKLRMLPSILLLLQLWLLLCIVWADKEL